MANARQSHKPLGILLLLVLWLASACQPGPNPAVGSMGASPAASETRPVTSVAAPPTAIPATGTPLPSPSPLPESSATPAPEICSPLAGYNRSDLLAAVFNPYHPPAAGLDDPHQGIDIADLEPIDRYARPGLAIQSVLDGVVAASIEDRFPYGNALIIESPLVALPDSWVEALNLPAVQPPQTPHPALTCPEAALPDWDLQTRSLYVLYAHMQQAPSMQPGDQTSCGRAIGAVGDSGNALNPHLHLEIRVGPAGARFDSLAHYDASASPEEMANYCTWRVSGVFQLIDPNRLVDLLP